MALGRAPLTEEEAYDRIEALKPGVYEAVSAFLEMHREIIENELTAADLAEGLYVAIDGPGLGDDGHDMAIITTTLMKWALELDKECRE